jgi:hypothetical protein
MSGVKVLMCDRGGRKMVSWVELLGVETDIQISRRDRECAVMKKSKIYLQ